MIINNVVYRLGDTEFEFRQGQKFLCSPKYADRLWSPDSLLFSEYFHGSKAAKV